MSYSQRHVVGYVMTDSLNGILVRHVGVYAAVNRGSPISIRYQGVNALVADNKALRIRQATAFVLAKVPAQGQVRQMVAYALRKMPPAGQIRQMVAYAVILKAQTVIKTKTGLDAFYDMLNANNKKVATIPVSPSNLGVGIPAPANVDDKNTGVVISAIGHYGYSGSATIYYNRIQIARLFGATDLKITVPAATTLRALITAINTAYGLFLVPEDVVDRPVPANATGLRLTAADTSMMWNPGTFVALGVDPGPYVPGLELGSVITVRKMNGFAEAV